MHDFLKIYIYILAVLQTLAVWERGVEAEVDGKKMMNSDPLPWERKGTLSLLCLDLEGQRATQHWWKQKVGHNINNKQKPEKQVQVGDWWLYLETGARQLGALKSWLKSHKLKCSVCPLLTNINQSTPCLYEDYEEEGMAGAWLGALAGW